LCLIERRLVLDACSRVDTISVVEYDAKVTDAPDAGFRANRGLSRFEPRIAQDALLALAARPVEIDLLVRAAGHAHTPAAALLLVDEDDTVFLALIDRTGRT
jgi:hypothetical protein